MTKDAIINDIEKHLSDSVKQYYRDFYVGITNDVNRRLFTDHNVDKDNDWWIYCKADSEEIARDVEKYYLELGMKGDTGCGSPKNLIQPSNCWASPLLSRRLNSRPCQERMLP